MWAALAKWWHPVNSVSSSHAPTHPAALIARDADRLGLEAAACAAYLAWAAGDPTATAPSLAVLQLAVRRKHRVLATRALAGLTAAGVGTEAIEVSLLFQAALLLADVGLPVTAWAQAALRDARLSVGQRAELLIAFGDLAAAEVCLAADAAAGLVAAALAARVELARWRGDWPLVRDLAGVFARQFSSAPLVQQPETADEMWQRARVVLSLGVAAATQGDPAAALAHVDQALSLAPQFAEALAFRGAWRLQAGDTAGGLADLDQAGIHSPAFSLPVALLRLRHSASGANVGRLETVAPAVAALVPNGPVPPNWLALEAEIPALLQSIGTNFSRYPTVGAEQDLRRVAVPASPRYRCRQALDWALLVPPAEVTAHLAQIVQEHPYSSVALAYAGEWQLWLGHLDAAEALLHAALDHWAHTRWPHAGLATVAVLRGDHAEAERWLDLGRQRMGGEGPPWLLLRAELAWRRRLLNEGCALAEAAVARQPGRTAAWLILGLAEFDRGGTTRGEQAAQAVAAGVPALWLAAERVAVVADPTQIPSQRTRLAAALRLMRGCRSSSLAVFAASDAPDTATQVVRWKTTPRGDKSHGM